MTKKTEVEKEIQDNLETSEGEKSAETKCDNHPQRHGRNYTGNGAYSINLCEECTPPWFTDEDLAKAL